MTIIKICKKCGATKPINLFTKVLRNKDGHSGSCLVCDNKVKYDYEGSKKRTKEFHVKNPEKAKEYYDKNKHNYKERQHLNTKSYRSANPGWMAAQCAKRRTMKLQATPKWSNEFFIEEAYRLAKLREKATGFKWHVDHIVPLQAKDACGLHTEKNLQVIPVTVNFNKNNTAHTEYRWSDFFNG